MNKERVDFSIARRPVELLQQLIRYDTTNPPGNEAKCIRYISTILANAADERIPVEALEFGTNAIYKLQQRFC